jgi:hypothetical protein
MSLEGDKELKNEGPSESNLDFLFFMASLFSLCLSSKQKVDRRRYGDVIGRSRQVCL